MRWWPVTVAACCLREVLAHNCIHDTHIVPSLLAHRDFPFVVDQTHDHEHGVEGLGHRRRLQAGGTPLRIQVDYTYLDSDVYQCTPTSTTVSKVDGSGTGACSPNDAVTPEKKVYIKKLTSAAVQWFSRALRVITPSTGPLQLRKFCYQYAPPPNFLASTPINRACIASIDAACTFAVPDVDFVLTVAASPTSGSTLAWALTCQSDAKTGRPIAGLVNYGASALTMDPLKWNSELSTAIHEIAHALGFSSSKFGDFLDESGKPRGASNVVRQFPIFGKTVSRIVTPLVVQQVKRQVHCFDWPEAGGELEDYGGSGTAGSHWEKRNFRDEFMTGTDSVNPVYSAISLALFEDSGWYKADYSVAENFAWGNKAGCTFAKDKCDQWEKKYFCRVQGSQGCTHDRFFKGYCNLAKYQQALPVQHQYFSADTGLGGRDAHADYCPFFAGYSNADCRVKAYMDQNSEKVYAESYGNTSRCFESSIINKKYVGGKVTPRCYPTVCKAGVLYFVSDGKEFACPTLGGEVKVDTVNIGGVVTCPPATDVCTPTSSTRAEIAQQFESEMPLTQLLATASADPPVITELQRGGLPADISLAAGTVAYFSVNMSSATRGGIRLQFENLKGAVVYVRSREPKDTTGVTEEERANPPPPRLPSVSNNDFTSAVTDAPGLIDLPTVLQDKGSQLLIAVAAPTETAIRGQLKLGAYCVACANGGTCVDGVCSCPAQWSGSRCDERSCPGGCSGHGVCDLEEGTCTCGMGWAGADCATKEELPANAHASGEVPVGKWTYFWVSCGEKASFLTYTLRKMSSNSDPFLFVQGGRDRPTATSFVARDLENWKGWSNDHSVTLPVRGGESGGATVGVWNTADYGHETLRYEGTVDCQLDGLRACPASIAGVCGGPDHGACTRDAATNANTCVCNAGWSGKGCEERLVRVDQVGVLVRSLELKQNDHAFLRIEAPSSLQDQKLVLYLKGATTWVGISGNRGTRQVKAGSPKVSDFNNYHFFDSTTKDKRNFVVIRQVKHPVYSLMLTNVKVRGSVTVDVMAHIEGSKEPGQGWTILGAAIDEVPDTQEDDAQELEDPTIPLSVLGVDGSLPHPVLTLSSRASVKAVASSNFMELIMVDEFCRQSSTGLYKKCSKIDGTVTVCADKPIIVYYESGETRPKDSSEFSQRRASTPGAPKKQWTHMASWQDSCMHHAAVDVKSGSSYVGVAALNPGEVITFFAVMQGKSSLFLSDTGDVRIGWYVALWSLLAAVVSAIITSTCFYTWWHRKQRAREGANVFVSRLHNTVATHRANKEAGQHSTADHSLELSERGAAGVA